MNRLLKWVGVAAFGAAFAFIATPKSNAETITIGGWQIDFPHPPIALSGIEVQSDGSVLFISEKDVNFTNDEYLPISFKQVSSSAAATIVIGNESISNSTGTDWSGFEFTLVETGSGNASFAGSSDTFAPPSGYSGVTFSSTDITYSGSQPDGSVTFWGIGADGDLVINADPQEEGGQIFLFKEVPVTGGPLVPLPAAAWQSLAGLACLGLVLVGKRVKAAKLA